MSNLLDELRVYMMERVISPTTRLGKGPAAFGQLASNVPRNHRPNPHFPIGQFTQIAGSIPYLVSILLPRSPSLSEYIRFFRSSEHIAEFAEKQIALFEHTHVHYLRVLFPSPQDQEMTYYSQYNHQDSTPNA